MSLFELVIILTPVPNLIYLSKTGSVTSVSVNPKPSDCNNSSDELKV